MANHMDPAENYHFGRNDSENENGNNQGEWSEFPDKREGNVSNFLYMAAHVGLHHVRTFFGAIKDLYCISVHCALVPIFYVVDSLVSFVRLAFLWLLICATVHFLDWYLVKQGSLARAVFGFLNQNYSYYTGIWGMVVDMLKPLGVAWTLFVPWALEEWAKAWREAQ